MSSSSSCRSSGDDTRGPRWLQINLELGSDATSGGDRRALWASVFALVQALADQDLLHGFHFVRKPPGLRFRFALDGTRHLIAGEQIESRLDELVDRQLATRWHPSVYEPEVFKFGGPAAIDAIHAYFAADSAGWWRWEELCAGGEPRVDARLFSVAVLNDLFGGFTDGPEEVWDVWCHLAVLHGDRVTLGGPPAPTVSIADVVDRVSPPEAALLGAYASSNADLADRFRALHAAGRLLFANRLVLPHVALYHWNRYGFDPRDRASMYTRMIRAWSPHD